MKTIDRLDPDKITENLKTKRIGREVLVFKATASTNDIAAEYAKNSENDGLVVFAEKQTAGRGRRSNVWVSPGYQSVLCSVVLRDTGLAADLLSLTAAVAAAEAVGGGAKIKWPNDIILNGKKVGGILLESKTHSGRRVYIIGFGINCHQKERSFGAELKAIATSINIESGAVCDRVSVAKRLLSSLDHWLRRDEKKVISRWRKLSIQLGHRVTVVFNRKKFTGNCIGIDPQKGLILQLERGGIRMFDAAHTTIAK